jgi:hypothetical protein
VAGSRQETTSPVRQSKEKTVTSITDSKGFEDLVRIIAEFWPGGKYVASHLADGPFHAMVVTEADEPNWIAKAALDACPSVVLPCLSGCFFDPAALGEVPRGTLVLVPDIVRDLLLWNEDENELLFAEVTAAFTDSPADVDLAQVVADMLTMGSGEPDAVAPNPDLLAVLGRALAAAGLDGTARLLQGLTLPVLRDQRQLAGVLDAALREATSD